MYESFNCTPAKLSPFRARESIDNYSLNLTRTQNLNQHQTVSQITLIKNNKPNFSKSISNKNTNYGFILIVITALLAIFLMGNISNKPANDTHQNFMSNENDLKVQNENLKKFLNQLKSKYSNQSNLFWANIESSFRHSVIKSKDPSIILIVNDKDTQKLAKKSVEIF